VYSETKSLKSVRHGSYQVSARLNDLVKRFRHYGSRNLVTVHVLYSYSSVEEY
jgi:hypothetical protein